MRKKSVYLRFFMPCCGDARFGKQGRCAHTCYFCVAGGPQKCLYCTPEPSESGVTDSPMDAQNGLGGTSIWMVWLAALSGRSI